VVEVVLADNAPTPVVLRDNGVKMFVGFPPPCAIAIVPIIRTARRMAKYLIVYSPFR
jgi:hypothetical protein